MIEDIFEVCTVFWFEFEKRFQGSNWTVFWPVPAGHRGWKASVPAQNLGARIYIGTRTNPFLADACRAPSLKSLGARRKISVPRAPGHPLISSPAFQKGRLYA